MIKEYTLQGLGCAHCAAQIEESVKQLGGVSYASVNLVTALLQIELSSSFPANLHLHREIERIVKQHDSAVSVVEKVDFIRDNLGSAKSSREKMSKRKIVWLSVGAVILAAGIALEHLYHIDGYLRFAIFFFVYILLGGKVVMRAAKNTIRGKLFDEYFLMTIATIGAFAIGEYAEAVGVMLFFQVGMLLQELAVSKSKKSIARLMDIRPDYANLLQAGELSKVAPETIAVGDMIVVKPGEKIPLDGVVIEGAALLDTTALTGEAVPRRALVSDSVLSGCVNQDGVLTIKVTQVFSQSTVSKIIDLVENAASKKATTENFITKFAKYYTPVVVVLALLIALVPTIVFGGPWSDWLYRSLIFLVISCPCALVISIPLGFFGGIGGASKKGILVKGGNYLEALSNLDIVVFDKTGTLTKGVFKVAAIRPSGTFTANELLEAAARAEAFSNHPIAFSILCEYGKALDKTTLSEYSEIAGFGVRVNAKGKTILAGNEKLMAKRNIVFKEAQDIGTKVYVALDGVYMGCLVISDEIKQDSYTALAALKAFGIRKTVMLSGDNQHAADAIGKELNIDEVFGDLLPQEKVEKVELLSTQKRAKGKLAFVGDGINDAPVLASADIGVAMGAFGADAAIEAADVVLMTDEPSKLAEAVEVARFTKRIVVQNIVFALGIKVLFLLLGALGVATLWEAVFADVGVALLAVLNAMRVMRN